MKEIILNYMPEICAALVSVIAAGCGLAVTLINNHKTRVLKKELEKALAEAKAKETYTVCPCCDSKLLLSQLTFHLPGGSIDQNLNGVPDDQE